MTTKTAKAPPSKTPAKPAAKKAPKKGGGPAKPRPLAIVIPAQAGVIAAKRKNAWKPGDVKKDQKIDGDGDGVPVDRWVSANAAKAGQTDAQWLAAATTRARANGSDVPDLKSSDDVQGYLDGLYAGDSGSHDAYNKDIYPFWKKAGAKHDVAWQYKTSLRNYTGQTKDERVWDKSKKSWVTIKVPVMEYVDPDKVPYIVRNDAPIGSIFKVTYVDANKVTHSTYTVVADTGTNRAEMSQAALDNLGIKGGPDGIKSSGSVSLEYLGQGDVSKMPTADSVKSDGASLEKSLKDGKPPAKKKTAATQLQGGAAYMAQVPNHGVVSGTDQLLVAVNHVDCKHSGGAYVTSGSSCIFVGKELSPLAGEGDDTSDGLAIRKGTGDQTVIMA